MMKAWIIVLMGFFLTACGQEAAVVPSAFKGTDMHDVSIHGDRLLLSGSDGRAHRLQDFRGKAVLLTFGYTHCDDVCPGTLAELARAKRLLGQDGKQVQVLFVTVDPARDTKPVLAKFVGVFDSSFLGLYGDDAATSRTAKDFHIFYQKQAHGEEGGAHAHHAQDGGYAMAHSTGTYGFDPQGRLRVFIPYGTRAPAIAHDLHLLLQTADSREANT